MATPPRRIRKGEVHEVSRRTVFRQLMLIPKPMVRQLLLYILGLVSDRYNVTLFAAVIMYNHYHQLLRDNDGRLPDYMRDFDSLVARALNAFWKKDDAFWSSDGYVPLQPVTAEDQLSRLRYILANPLEADLVRDLVDFPGVMLRPEHIGKPIEVERPDFFFGRRSKLPDKVTVTFAKLPEYEHLSDEEYAAFLREQITDLEAANRKRRKQTDATVLGPKRLQRIQWTDRPTSREQWFRLRPEIAAKNKALRIAAIRALQAFRGAYRIAYEAYCEGERDVEFPHGTWDLRVRFGVNVAPPAPG